MGRPTKQEQTNAKISETAKKRRAPILQKLRDAFAIDATIKEACFYAGISERTYYKWKEENPKEMQEIEDLRMNPVLAARKTVVNAIKTDSGVAFRYLERKRSDEFMPQHKIEHSGKVETEGAVSSEEVQGIVDDFEDRLKKAIVDSRKNDNTKPSDKAPQQKEETKEA